MANAKRDQNFVPTLIGVSSSDGVTPVNVYVDPITHRLLVDLASGAGTVTTVSVATANGFAGSVTNPTTTPEITIETTITGIIKGDGTAISAASAGTDYVAPGSVTASGLTMSTARILGRTTASTGSIEEITIGSGLTLSAGTLSASGSSFNLTVADGVTSVSSVDTIVFSGATVTDDTGGQVTVTIDPSGVQTITGTSNRITVDNTDPANPIVDIAATYVGQTSITTLGTISTGTWNATTVAVNKGGTGQTSYTNGQLLIGNTTGNTLDKGTLTAGTGIGISNGAGSITISASAAGLSVGTSPIASGTTTRVLYDNAGVLGEYTITGSGNVVMSTSPTITTPTIAGSTGTGVNDYGGATSFEIPNSAAPTIDADGEIAVDTTVTDFSAGVVKYYSGEEMGVVAMPVAEFISPTDGDVVTYNATADEFQLQQPSGSIDVQQFDYTGSGQTWTKPSSGTYARVQMWGGGGAGSYTSNSTYSGGGGGGYTEGIFLLSALGATVTVTVGAGGAAQTTNNTSGAAGGNTTFGTHATAYGGGGGYGNGSNYGGGGGGGLTGAGATTSGGGAGGTGGAGGGTAGAPGTSSDFGGGGGGNAFGAGGGGSAYGGGGGAVRNGTGGSSVWGGGGGGGAAAGTSVYGGAGGVQGAGVAGTNGSVPGGGGGGSNTSPSGAGGNGRCIVTVF